MNLFGKKHLMFFVLMVCSFAQLVAADPEQSKDPYENYVKTSKDFKAVKQDKEMLLKAWPTFIYMPWYYQWKIGYGEEGGKFCKDNGYNGAFIDWGNGKNLDFINKNKLRFYMDHSAGKGDLYIKNSNKTPWQEASAVKMRSPMINDALLTKLKGVLSETIGVAKTSEFRAAYSLDDEISWGSFVKPCMWQIADDSFYRAWLKEVYGATPPANPGWIGYEAIRAKLPGWTIGTFDCHQFMNQLSFNDSHWGNFLGELVEYSNTLDPNTPVGFVGAQSPNAFGGYDYAKLMKKVQFIEAYGLDDTQTVVRSFNPGNAIPVVSTHFHKATADTVWQTWYSISHGNKGFIGWVEGWFDDTNAPKEWHKELAPHYKEVGQTIGPLMHGTTWIHDKVAIYYSQPSIQMSWILDAEAFGKTWPKRNGDDQRATWGLVHRAWRKMLKDEGIQINYINYAEVIKNGVPPEFKVLILPSTYCLSDVEAREIKKFCENGGTVIGDFLTGVFDQHGVGRPNGGVLDGMFGIKQDPNVKQADVFTKGIWVEVDQDSNYGNAGKFEAFLTNANTSKKHESGFNIAVPAMPVNTVTKMGKGTAVFFNLSPQWYNAYRQKADGFEDCKKRSIFMDPIHKAGVNRWVEIENADASTANYEITYWEKGGRTILFLCTNADSTKTELGGGNSVGLKTGKVEVTLVFKKPIKGVKNERTGETLKEGTKFKVSWVQNEAVVLSYEGKPY